MVLEDAVGEALCGILLFELNHEAFPEVPCSNARRVELLDDRQHGLQLCRSGSGGCGEFFQGAIEVTVFVQAGDQQLS